MDLPHSDLYNISVPTGFGSVYIPYKLETVTSGYMESPPVKPLICLFIATGSPRQHWIIGISDVPIST